MAPEQITGQNLTLKADVFSFGTILWEMATEQIPHYDVRNNMDAIAKGANSQNSAFYQTCFVNGRQC